MTIESSSAAGESQYSGTTFYFCTIACKREFDENPAKYNGKAVSPQEPSKARQQTIDDRL